MISSAWSTFAIVTLRSTFLAALPQLIITGFLLIVTIAALHRQFKPHYSHSLKLQEALLKENIDVERMQKKGYNHEKTYYCSLDSDDLLRDRPEFINQEISKVTDINGSLLRSNTSQLLSANDHSGVSGQFNS